MLGRGRLVRSMISIKDLSNLARSTADFGSRADPLKARVIHQQGMN